MNIMEILFISKDTFKKYEEYVGVRLKNSVEEDFKKKMKMKDKMLKFFEFDVAPEIVDPEHPKEQPMRQPEYRLLAIAEKLRRIEGRRQEAKS